MFWTTFVWIKDGKIKHFSGRHIFISRHARTILEYLSEATEYGWHFTGNSLYKSVEVYVFTKFVPVPKG